MLKILSIGNSFSCDAQRYLHAIAKAQGVDLLCCNLYIGGCSLAHHWDCFVNEKPEYGWYVNGEEIANGYTVSRGLAADDWDVITLQQVSHDTGKPESYEPYLSNLLTAITAMFPDAKLYFHETWEYEDKSTHPFFINYQNDPDAMYRAIDETCHAKAKEYELTLIPSGRAVHAAKQLDAFDPEKGGISLYRDKFHMGMIYGRYLVGCVWFKTITGKSPVGNRYIPTDTAEGEVVDAERIAQLQKVAANTFA